MKNYDNVSKICEDLKGNTHIEGLFKNELHFSLKNAGEQILIQQIKLTKYVFGDEKIMEDSRSGLCKQFCLIFFKLVLKKSNFTVC